MTDKDSSSECKNFVVLATRIICMYPPPIEPNIRIFYNTVAGRGKAKVHGAVLTFDVSKSRTQGDGNSCSDGLSMVVW